MLSSDAAAAIVNDPNNTANLDDLYGALRGPGIIPFVGAGLSRPFGFPEWGGFLRAQASMAGAAASAVIEARLGKGEYEEAASDLQDALGDLAFEDAIRRTFGRRDLGHVAPDAAVRSLPALAAGPVLTTNFDHVLESVFEDAGRKFDHIACGAPRDQVAQALHVNARLLWKLHGDGDYGSSADRVLTPTEYAEHYGDADPAQFDWHKPLPALFENLLVARPVLFLGSSLNQDRTVRVLHAFSRRHRGVGHYALLSHPGDEDARRAQVRALSNVGIRPLWFPSGRFELIGPFLHYLAGCLPSGSNKADIASQQARIEESIDAERQIRAGAASSSDAPQRVVGDRPLNLKGFRGRSAKLKEIGEHLTSTETRVVSLVGPSGMGKTALAVRLLSDLEQNRWPPQIEGRTVDGIAYLSTRTGGITFERLFLACARMLGGAARANLERDWAKDRLTIDDKIDRLLEAMRGGLFVILLDHIEDFLDAEGVITDPEIRKLVERTLTAPSGTRLLVTSHIEPALSHDTSQAVRLKDGLSVDDGIAMLRDRDRDGSAGLRDLPDAELERIVTRVHGVPRALEVFFGILNDDTGEGINQLLDRFYERKDVIDRLYKEGIERLDEPSQRVVEALAVLGQPIPSGAVDLLLQPFVPGLDVPATLRRLSRSQIVQLANRAKETWSLQPIDQDFAYGRCPEIGRYSRQALHHLAAQWYFRLRTPPEKWKTLEGVEPLLREFDHLVKAGLYDDAGAVLAEFDDFFGGRFGQASRSLAMHRQIEGRVTIDRVRLRNTFGIAHAYRHIGPLESAIACYRQALDMARAQQNTNIEIDALGWIGETFRRLQRLDEASDSTKKAVDTARQVGNRTLTARWLGELALESCYRGAPKEALTYAEDAYQIAVELNDINWQALAVDCLALVHLTLGDAERSIALAEQAIRAYQQGTRANSVIYLLNVEGLAYLELRKVERAIECLDRACREARATEDARVEGITRVNLAHASRITGDVEQALQHAEEAVAIFTRTQGGELEAARALTDALRAGAAGLAAAEAQALIKLTKESMSNPDLLNPRAFLHDAITLAQRASRPEIAAEGEGLILANQARSGAQLA